MKEKTLLHPNSIFRKFGIKYLEDAPEYHIDGKECSEAQMIEHRRKANLEYPNTFLIKQKALDNYKKSGLT